MQKGLNKTFGSLWWPPSTLQPSMSQTEKLSPPQREKGEKKERESDELCVCVGVGVPGSGEILC